MRVAELLDQAKAMWGRLARRERLLVMGALLTFVGFTTLMVVLRINAAVDDRVSSIAFKEHGLNQVISMSSGFREAQAEQRRIESQLRGQGNLSLFSYMEEIARDQGMSISNMTPRQPVTEGNIREETVEVSLDGVTLDKVAELVNAIQRSPHMVKISSLRIRRRGSAEEVQANLSVSSYALVEAGQSNE